MYIYIHIHTHARTTDFCIESNSGRSMVSPPAAVTATAVTRQSPWGVLRAIRCEAPLTGACYHNTTSRHRPLCTRCRLDGRTCLHTFHYTCAYTPKKLRRRCWVLFFYRYSTRSFLFSFFSRPTFVRGVCETRKPDKFHFLKYAGIFFLSFFPPSALSEK